MRVAGSNKNRTSPRLCLRHYFVRHYFVRHYFVRHYFVRHYFVRHYFVRHYFVSFLANPLLNKERVVACPPGIQSALPALGRGRQCCDRVRSPGGGIFVRAS